MLFGQDAPFALRRFLAQQIKKQILLLAISARKVVGDDIGDGLECNQILHDISLLVDGVTIHRGDILIIHRYPGANCID